MDREAFEEFVRSSSNFPTLIFCYGERLFIFENGEYRILAIQLAWTAWLHEHHYSARTNKLTDWRNWLINLVLWLVAIITLLVFKTKLG